MFPAGGTLSAKLVAAAGAAALILAACGGSVANPTAGSPAAAKGRGKIDNPATNRPNHVACLKSAHVPVARAVIDGAPGLVLGASPGAPSVVFEPTPGVAQGLQIKGVRWAQGAEVIGSALLFPNAASDSRLKTIETCLAKGVAG
jgi:hypothetical protein